MLKPHVSKKVRQSSPNTPKKKRIKIPKSWVVEGTKHAQHKSHLRCWAALASHFWVRFREPLPPWTKKIKKIPPFPQHFPGWWLNQPIWKIRRPPRQARGGGAWEGQCQSITFSFLEKANLYVSMPKLEFDTKDKTKDSIVTPLGLGILLKMLYSTASKDAFATPWAWILLGFHCFASMPHGCIHRPRPPTMRLCPALRHAPIICTLLLCFYGFRRCCIWHRLWGPIWHALGSNSAGVPLFRKHASRTRSSAMSTYAPICPAIRHAPIYPCFCPCFCCVFTGFEDAVRHRLWGSIWHALGSNSAGVPLFRKHASRTRSSAMSTYTRLYVQLSAMRLYIHAFVHAFCFYGFRRCCTAPPLGTNLARLGLEFCWGSAVSQACLTDAFIGHVHLRAYMSSYPPCAYISMLLSMLLLCFYGFRRCCTAPPLGWIWHALGSNAAGVPLFRKHASRMRSSAMSTYHAPMSSSPPCAYYMHAFALCLRASKMLYGTASGDEFGTPWARMLLGFRCFASMPHGCVHRPCPPTMRLCPALRHAPMICTLCFVLTGFEDAVRHRLWGWIWHALGLNPAGVPLFRKHASRTRSSAMSTCHAPMSSSPPCA